MAEWSSRPLVTSLDAIDPVIVVNALVVKVREGQVRNTPFYVVMGVTVNGERDILGIWAGSQGGEGARFWLQVFSELKNRGVADVLIAVCDGLKGLPEAITTTWERTVVQTCVVHLLRNSFSYAGHQHRDAIAKALRPVYTAPSQAAAKERFDEFAEAWAARYRRAVKARGHFPTKAAALKCLYLVTRSLHPTGKGRTRWMIRWKPALNAFATTFAGRFETDTNH